MDRNILEEYQKRVDEMLATLGKYEAIISEGIEESQERTDNRLSELQARREELEQPIDMSDVSATVIDRRATIDREYSDDREGYLLREYDKRRLDGYDGPKFAEIVDEIRTIRENRRLEQKEAVEVEMQDLIAEQVDIDNARDAEAEKVSLIMQLQEEKDKIEADIQSKKDKAEGIMAKFEEVTEEATVHAKTLTLYKDKRSKVYTTAKEELERCMKNAKKSQNRVKRLAREISHLEQDLGEVDKLLEGLEDSKKMDEVSRQEDEMWEQYRAETAVTEETRDRDIDVGVEEKQLEEANEEDRVARETEKEVEEYDKNLGDRLDNEGICADGLNTEKPEKPQAPQSPIATPTPTQPQSPQKPTQPPKTKKPDSPQQPLNTNFEVKTVGLMIEDDGKPRYYAIMYGKDGQEITVKSKEKGGFEDISTITEELRTELTAKGIYQPDKYYDAGLDNFLVELDTMYGRMQKSPSGSMRPIDRDAYVTMIAQKNMMVGKKPIPFEVIYDLSNLYRMPETAEGKKKLKSIKKIARANSNQGLATYEKAPGIFKRLWTLLKTKSLTEAKIDEEIITTQETISDGELDSLEELLCSQYRARYYDKDFDPYKLTDITKEEADIIAKDVQRVLAEEGWAVSKFKDRTRLENMDARRNQKMTFTQKLRNVPSSILNKVHREEEPNGTFIVPRSKPSSTKGTEREPGDE